MLAVPRGDYLPFYKGKSSTRTIPVPAFEIDARPVSEGNFSAFVSASPRWQRSRVGRLFAEKTYLADWAGDASLGPVRAGAAATRVSWFAAKAYCASVGRRLPTTVEWERALGVLGVEFAATSSSSSTLAANLWEWTADFNSVPVAGEDDDTNGSVATLFCGAGARATDATDYGAFLRYSFRSSLRADFALKNLTFRCATGGS
jgi:formylglycine-generating enzyme required for sulfatase activity